MTCPKCHGDMRTYERNGISVDQCADCRGIFLDRGELEHLVNAENTWAAAPAQAPVAAPTQAPVAPPNAVHAESNKYYDSRYYPSYDKKKKKRNFLEELFD